MDIQSASMPKRLLRLKETLSGESGTTVCVTETETMAMTPYTAISYCWGPQPQKTLLKKDKYEQLCHGVPIEGLQPTLRDALIITQQLGFAYVWIDALCILQDDDVDKALEIVRMPSIYHNAAVTIIASRASSVDQGFLHPRPALGLETLEHVFRVAFEPPATGSGNANGDLYIIPQFEEHPGPWDYRSWTLQERLFSKRTLKLGEFQTTWICHGGYSEPIHPESDGWAGWKGANDEDNSPEVIDWRGGSITGEKLMFDICNMLQTIGSRKREDILEKWYQLIQIFTHRSLTFASDRLPAMSGIAQHFAQVLQSEYICGHWKSEIPLGLLWFTAMSPYDKDAPKRPSQFIGPSWSWAGYPGFILPAIPSKTDIIVDPDFTVMGCTAEPMHPAAPLGAVKAGNVKVRGYLAAVDLALLFDFEYSVRVASRELEAELAKTVPPKPPSPEYISCESMMLSLDFPAETALDFETLKYPEFPKPVSFLVVAHDDGDPAGLVLLGSKDKDVYTRLGSFMYKRSTLERKEEEDAVVFEERRRSGLGHWWGHQIRELTIL
jgi:hypothetical protein